MKLQEKNKKHFFQDFFTPEGYFVKEVVLILAETLVKINKIALGYAKEMQKRILSLNGFDIIKYEQIVDILAEITIAKHAFEIADKNVEGEVKLFETEPGLEQKKKTPEFRTSLNGINYAIEVKCPSLTKHAANRTRGPYQLPARNDILKNHTFAKEENLVLPKDNPIKDFLISANQKYEAYKETYPDDFRILVIVWDQFMYEPSSVLMNDFTSIFTKNSFIKDENETVEKFENVDGVIVVKHLHNINGYLQKTPLLNGCKNVLDFNGKNEHNTFFQNPYGRTVPQTIIENFQCVPVTDETKTVLPSDYAVIDWIMWM